MSEFFQTGRDRSERRTRREMLMPPEDQRSALAWHQIDTATSRLTLQWRPGIEVWLDRDGKRFTAEKCHEWGWTYYGRADQIGKVS
jgi:hypothetical protein